MLLRVRAVLVLLLVAAPLAGAPAPAPRKAASHSAAAEPAVRPDVISLDLKDVEIRDALRAFAELERFNLVIDPEVRGSVTVRLENVRWEDAMDVILRSNGLGWVLVGNVVRAAPPGKLAAEP